VAVQFVLQPEVYITASMQPIDKAIDAYFAARKQPGSLVPRDRGVESCVVLGSRTCYESYDKGRPHEAHCAHVIESGHLSVLEHAVFQVVLAGISRSCSRQLIRHRHLSPSEKSQRFIDCSDIRFVVPPADLPAYEEWQRLSLTPAAAEFNDFHALCYQSLEAYKQRLNGSKTKQQKEAARSRLLESAESIIVFTGNVSAYRNLFQKRCREAADAEIRRVCCELFVQMQPLAPNLLADYTKRPLSDGTFHLTWPTTE
jgi:thymidylate synthase (FAD)